MSDRRNIALIVGIVVLVAVAGSVSYLLLSPRASIPPSHSYVAPALCPSSGGVPTAGNWTTYHRDGARDGDQAAAPITAARTMWAAPSDLDGQVYAEPLICGNAVFVATENDSVYALNSSTGGLLWRTHLGAPVPGNSLPCGDIDPSGITGTPVIDAATGTLYVVAFLVTAQHVLFGLSVANGTIRSQTVVDPVGADPTAQQQRGSLALANGMVYVPYGGLDGDCGQYHGWVVGVRTDGTGGLFSYQVPTHREGGIWSVAGITVAANGSLYVATGNGDSTTTFDFGDSVIELTPSLAEVDYFAPTNWAQLNVDDTDLGSVAPTLLPDGDLFQIGKAGVGYLLAGSHLGGIGGQLAEGSVCGGAYGGTARSGQTVLVPCVDGLYDVAVSASNFSVVWHTSSFDAGSPIVTGNVAWVLNISTADLLGFNVTTGTPLFSFPLGSVDHFCSPAASSGAVFVAGGAQLAAFSLS
ncbi:MAG: PQQ-binding-like beta-propeller repeat protein [Thermoplasmata archaeon]|nr:PQQ-binding-like beta-propeller repeat protein [Thermoplasmata archaeon]